MATLNLQVVSLDGVVYDEDDVLEVTLHTTEGDITVLANHIPLIAPLKEGEVRIKRATGEEYLSISRGVVEVRPKSKVVLLTNRAKRV
ncbi:MAG: ATP synthase F1 subunit epsilon [bacterium]|nr:ATP synthase F1 subunit epsilon [bacterium]